MSPCLVWSSLVCTATVAINSDTCWFRGRSRPQLKLENKTAASSFSPVDAGSLEGDSAACRAAERRAFVLEASHFNTTAELPFVVPQQPAPPPLLQSPTPPPHPPHQADFADSPSCADAPDLARVQPVALQLCRFRVSNIYF